MPKKKDNTVGKSRRRAAKSSNAILSRFFAPLRTAGKVAPQHVFATAVISVCLLGAGIWGVVALITAPEIGPEVGNRAPEFSLQTTDGQNVSLRDFRGRMVMLTFWGDLGNHDGRLDQEIHSIQGARDKWPEKELAILGINVWADRAAVEEFITRHGLTFPVLLDSEGVGADYDIMRCPVHLFIDARGIIRLATVGHFSSQDEIEDILNSIKTNTDMKSIAPTISDVSASATDKSAIITWVTDEPSASDAIVCDTEHGPHVPTSPDGTLVTEHSVAVHGLAPDTTCHFQVLSGYNLENQALSKKYSFTTLTDVSPPVIWHVDVSNVAESSATIKWQTDEPGTSEVEYWITDSWESITVSLDESTSDHSVSLSGLQPYTRYHVELKSKDATGHEATLHIFPVITLSALPIGTGAGMRAPDFTLPTIDGESLTLSGLRGKIVMINFWLSGCQPCIVEMPHIQAVFEEWSDDDLVILAINVRESTETVRSFVDNQGLSFPVLLDSEGMVDEVYQPALFPTTSFIDADGIIREVKEGRFHSPEEIESILNSL